MNYEALVKEHYNNARLEGDMDFITCELYWWIQAGDVTIGHGSEMIDAWEDAYNNIKNGIL